MEIRKIKGIDIWTTIVTIILFCLVSIYGHQFATYNIGKSFETVVRYERNNAYKKGKDDLGKQIILQLHETGELKLAIPLDNGSKVPLILVPKQNEQ